MPGASGFSSQFPRTFAVVERHRALQPGFQLHVVLGDGAEKSAAWGEAKPGLPMSEETLLPWLSSGKPLTALGIARLLDEGKLQLEDPVARHLPQFGGQGKRSITIAHLLTHTAGLRGVEPVSSAGETSDLLQTIYAAVPESNWTPGERAGYQIGATWLLLAAVIEKLEKTDFRRWIRDQVLLPLGLSETWVGFDATAWSSLQERIGVMQECAAGQGKIDPVWGSGEMFQNVRPGGNTVGSARDLARFYRRLLEGRRHGLPGVAGAATLQRFTTPQRVGLMDETFRHRLDWGFGFMINSSRLGPLAPYGFGLRASPDSFGHSGSQSSCGFADPGRELAVAWICNGRPGEPKHQARAREINEALYLDLFG